MNEMKKSHVSLGTVDGTSSGKWELCFKQKQYIKAQISTRTVTFFTAEPQFRRPSSTKPPFWRSVLLLSLAVSGYNLSAAAPPHPPKLHLTHLHWGATPSPCASDHKTLPPPHCCMCFRVSICVFKIITYLLVHVQFASLAHPSHLFASNFSSRIKAGKQTCCGDGC